MHLPTNLTTQNFSAKGLPCALLCCSLWLAPSLAQSQTAEDYAAVDREVFQLGLFTGVLNLGDFGSEIALGISGTLQASERAFLQFNYLQAEAELSSYEQSQGRYFSGGDRDFQHYDLLVGYKLFQGELYPEPGTANLSSFYLVGGVGETRFGGEENFSFTAGLGYEYALSRQLIVHADYRLYLYDSALVRDEERSTESSLFSIGIDYLF